MVLNMKGNFQIKSSYRLKIHFWQNAKPNKKESLDSFIIDNSWLASEAMKNGEGINVNTEAIKMI